jgi:predicted AlkP superfamily pyrophosphatase or phosphodiesterase
LLFVAPAGSQGRAPRLLVIVVVDQMKADYLNLFQKHWVSGFRTLLGEGAVFERAEYPYANTVTCAAHATVGTGAFPHTHGITGNTWWDRDKAALVDCSIDASAASAHISYGRPASSGNGPHLLMADTLGDVLRRQRPASRVVALSLKPDSAVTLAGHGGDVVTWFNLEAGSFVTSRAYAAAPNRAVTDFLADNPLTRELSATWTLLKSPDSYVNPDATPGQRPPAGRDGLFPHEIGGRARPDARSMAFWQQSPLSDRYLARMAAALMERLELGRDDNPDVLAIGFSALDLVGHAFGPGSREVEDVLVNLDGTLGNLFEALDRYIGRDRYVLALTADHGVAPVPQPPNAGRLIAEDMEERIEELLVSRWGPAARYYVAVRGPYVYFGPGILDRWRRDPVTQRDVLHAISEFPGVLRVLSAAELSVASSDPFVRAAALSHVPGRSGDLFIVPQPGWIAAGRNATNATTHGTSHEYDRRVPLILMGGPVRAGRFTRNASPADIAPTFASLVGVTLPKAEGRVLREALK